MLVLATVMAGGGRAPVARAAEPAEVEALIRQGVELRRQNRNAAAPTYLQKAYDLQRSPRTAAQLGMVEAALGYWLASERHLQEAMESPRHPWVAENRAQIEGAFDSVRGFIGEIIVVGAPAGAEVVANGQPAGRLPGPIAIRLGEGTVKLGAESAGHLRAERTVRGVGGERYRVRFNLERPTASPPPARPCRASPSPPRRLPGGGCPGRRPPPRRRFRRSRRWRSSTRRRRSIPARARARPSTRRRPR